MAAWSAEKALWQLSPVKDRLQAGQVTPRQKRPEQRQLGGLAHSVQSLFPAAGNGRVLFLGYRAQGPGCSSPPRNVDGRQAGARVPGGAEARSPLL